MKSKYTRRRFLTTTAAAGAATLAMPSLSRAADREITVGTYGGFFEESFRNGVYPDFTAATGIKVNSVAVPTGETYIVQIRNAARGKKAPADVAMMANVPRLRGQAQNLFKRLDPAKIPNLSHLPEEFQYSYDDGSFYASAAIAWFITLVTNTDVMPDPVESWAEMWDPKHENSLGLLGLATNSNLLEITSTTFLGGTDILDSQDGIEQAFQKLAELTPNVRLWYKDEGTFQQRLVDGEIPWGQYYHDVTVLKAMDGEPLRSNFPKEGGVRETGSWIVPEHSTMDEEVHVYINYMLDPAIQAHLARNVGTAPVVDPAATGLSAEEFAMVSSDITPIVPKYQMYFDHGDWIADRWSQLISS